MLLTWKYLTKTTLILRPSSLYVERTFVYFRLILLIESGEISNENTQKAFNVRVQLYELYNRTAPIFHWSGGVEVPSHYQQAGYGSRAHLTLDDFETVSPL